MEISADPIDVIVTFLDGASALDNIEITFDITDDEVGLEAVETYRVSFEILTSTDLVRPGIIQTTDIFVMDNDGW